MITGTMKIWQICHLLLNYYLHCYYLIISAMLICLSVNASDSVMYRWSGHISRFLWVLLCHVTSAREGPYTVVHLCVERQRKSWSYWREWTRFIVVINFITLVLHSLYCCSYVQSKCNFCVTFANVTVLDKLLLGIYWWGLLCFSCD